MKQEETCRQCKWYVHGIQCGDDFTAVYLFQTHQSCIALNSKCFEIILGIANNKHQGRRQENPQKERKPLPFFLMPQTEVIQVGQVIDAQQELHPAVADTRCWSACRTEPHSAAVPTRQKALLLMTTFSRLFGQGVMFMFCPGSCVKVLAGELFTIRSSHLMFTNSHLFWLTKTRLIQIHTATAMWIGKFNLWRDIAVVLKVSCPGTKIQIQSS